MLKALQEEDFAKGMVAMRSLMKWQDDDSCHFRHFSPIYQQKMSNGLISDVYVGYRSLLRNLSWKLVCPGANIRENSNFEGMPGSTAAAQFTMAKTLFLECPSTKMKADKNLVCEVWRIN